MKKLKKQLKQLQHAYSDLSCENAAYQHVLNKMVKRELTLEENLFTVQLDNASYKRLNDNLAISEANSIEHIIDLNNDLKVQEKIIITLEKTIGSAEIALDSNQEMRDKEVKQMEKEADNYKETISNLGNVVDTAKAMYDHLERTLRSAENALIYKEDLYDKALHAIGVLTIRAGVE